MRTLILVFAFLIGCTPTIKEQIAYKTSVVVDFSEYAGQGFLITPQDYGGDFVSLGMVITDFHPDIQKISMGRGGELRRQGEIVIATGGNNNFYHYKKQDSRAALDAFVKEAQSKGGDAIINFRIDNIGDYGSVVRLSGYIIKRNSK